MRDGVVKVRVRDGVVKVRVRDGVAKVRVRDGVVKVRVRDVHIIPCPFLAGCEKNFFYALLCNEKFQSTVNVSSLFRTTTTTTHTLLPNQKLYNTID